MAKHEVQVKKPAPGELEQLGVPSWPIWTKEVSVFDWHYDEQEVCYFLAGQVEVRTAQGTVRFGEGDLVTFPAGLSCTWDVRQPVRKHYRFG